jgi:hypothetical protein
MNTRLPRCNGRTPSPHEIWICRSWVASELGPFIPQQRTSGDCIGTSVLCHKQTSFSPQREVGANGAGLNQRPLRSCATGIILERSEMFRG